TRAATTHGRLHLMTGEYGEAVGIYERAIVASHEAGYLRGEGGARQGLGNAYRELMRRDLALEEHRRALEIWRYLGDTLRTASELINFASVLAELGRYEEARPAGEE